MAFLAHSHAFNCVLLVNYSILVKCFNNTHSMSNANDVRAYMLTHANSITYAEIPSFSLVEELINNYQVIISFFFMSMELTMS